MVLYVFGSFFIAPTEGDILSAYIAVCVFFDFGMSFMYMMERRDRDHGCYTIDGYIESFVLKVAGDYGDE